MKQQKFSLSEDNYYTLEADKIYCSASQYLNIIGRPSIPGCEARSMAILNGEYEEETTKAMLIGSILDCLWELNDKTLEEKIQIIADKYPECISSRGATKGELKNEYKQAIQLYQRTLKDELFCQFMSGEKQVIMTGEIEGLPFKIKMDSYIPDVAIVDLKTTQDTSRNFRKYIADSGNRETFYRAMGYDIQLAIYREIVRQNTGKTLRCYLACIDKNSHPLPQIIELTPKMLDDALASVKANIPTIKLLKSGEITSYVRCEECDYCRDTYKCKVLSAEEFETSDS
jgi:hypothetical protein